MHNNILYRKACVILIAFLSVLAPIVSYAFRIGYIFVDMIVFTGFMDIIVSLMLINAVVMLAFCYLFLIKSIKLSPIVKIVYSISFCLTLTFIIIDSIFFIKSPDDTKVFLVYLLKMLPFLGVIFTVLFLVFIYPRLKKRKRKVIGAVIIIAMFICICVPVFSLYPFTFASEPLVIDNGEGYIIIWATNDDSAGFVEYSYENIDYKIYDTESGKIVSSKIHRVFVPYEHLNNNAYSVHSTRVIDELGYGGRNGKTVSSKTYNFKGEIKDDLTMLIVSDWHCRVKELTKAANNLDEPDLVIMLGDYADSFNHINDVIKYIISAGASITSSEVPAIFVRGNHDTRGEAVTHLGYYLGLNSFYYEIERGDYRFLVLDSGEDKADSNPEYGGLANYEPYKTQQLDWMSALSPSEKAYTFVLSHDGSYHHSEPLSSLWLDEVIRYNANFILHGHNHRSAISYTDDYAKITVGGRIKKKEGLFSRVYFIASQITVINGDIALKSIDQYGNVYLDEEINF